MAMNYVQLYQAIQDYAENTEALFVNNIPRFTMEAEERVYNSVQIPALRRNVTGTLTSGNQYLSAPSDYLSTYSLAIIDSTGNYKYLLNKDVNFLREAYPGVVSNGTTYQGTPGGVPKYYALFGSQYSNANELSFIMAPTPDSNYNAELHYFYYPVSIVQGALPIGSPNNTLPAGSITTAGSGYTNGYYSNVPLVGSNTVTNSVTSTGTNGSGATANITVAGGVVTAVQIVNGGNFYVVGDTLGASGSYLGNSNATPFVYTISVINNSAGESWLGDNYDPVLFYGAMREAMLFMKGEQDLIKYYEDKYNDALTQLNRLGSGLERGDAYRDGQYRMGQVKP